MFYNKEYHLSDYLNYGDMNELVGKVKDLINIMGKNIIPTDVVGWEGGSYSDTGKVEDTHKIRTIDLIPAKPNTEYYCSIYALDISFDRVDEYDINGNHINTIDVGWNIPIHIITSSETAYLTFVIFNPRYQESSSLLLDELNRYIHPFVCLNSEEDKTYEEHRIELDKYDLDMVEYNLDDFVYVEDIDKIERNIMNLGYDFYQPPGYIQNKVWKDTEDNVYKSFSYIDLNRMITDMNLLYEYKNDTSTKYNLKSSEYWNSNTKSTLIWEE